MSDTTTYDTIPIGYALYVEWEWLRYTLTDVALTTATVTFTLTDANGLTVGALSDITMTYDSTTRSTYRGTIPATTVLTEDALYTLTVTAKLGSTTLATRRKVYRAAYLE